MKALVVLSLLIGSSAFAVEQKISVPRGINLVKVTVHQEDMPGCGPDNSELTVVKSRANKIDNYIIGDNKNITEEQLRAKLEELSENKTCGSFYNVQKTVQFVVFGSDEINVITHFPWKFKGEAQIQTLK